MIQPDIARDKIEKYLLKPEAMHSAEFFDVGYTVNDVDILIKDIREQFDINLSTDYRDVGDSAIHFSIFMDLGIGNKKKRFRTVWRKDTENAIPRLITAHRI